MKRQFPHIKLLSQSIKGNYFGAFASSDKDAQQGYVIFISHTEGVRNYCECTGWSIRETCYHMKSAVDLEECLCLTAN